MPRSRRGSCAPSARLREANVEATAECWDVYRARARDSEAEALHVTALLDVLQLIGIVECAEERILRPDRVDVEGRGHERAVHHDGRADAIDARRIHDPLLVHG